MTEEYLAQFRTTPLKLKSFDPRAMLVGKKWEKKVREIVGDEVEVRFRGSLVLGIEGKGDVDIAVYVTTKKVYTAVVHKLMKRWKVAAQGETFTAINIEDGEFKVEISVMWGHEAKVTRALQAHLENHPEIVEKYLEMKRKYCYSKREYISQRDKFFRKIIRGL